MSAPAPSGETTHGAGDAAESPWASLQACQNALARGERARREPGRARIGSWNVRWFPDGKPGKRVRSGTNIPFLACAIAWLTVDALVVEEFKLHASARDRLAQLLHLLDRNTGGRWEAHFDDCPNSVGQHVGILVDVSRVRASDWRTFGSLNPKAEPCRDQLRPGFGGYLRFPGGLDLFLIGAHLKSGTTARALALRQRSIEGFAAAYRESYATVADSDVVVAGDFNTMGCEQCSPRVGALPERRALSEQLEQLPAPFRMVEANLSCSHYFGRRPTLLDHFAASARLVELPNERRAEVLGDCAVRACRPLGRAEQRGAFSAELSDHCPIVLELDDRDED